MTEPQTCTCGTCKYSRTERVPDTFYNLYEKSMIEKELAQYPPEMVERILTKEITKCYIQGAPQKVKPSTDWCYKWEAV